eukprot:Skav205967  [mRNA]  locus=scaffold442:672488:719101:+ [translate_table: standard]
MVITNSHQISQTSTKSADREAVATSKANFDANLPGFGYKVLGLIGALIGYNIAVMYVTSRTEAWMFLEKMHLYSLGDGLVKKGFFMFRAYSNSHEAHTREHNYDHDVERLNDLWEQALAEATQTKSFDTLCEHLQVDPEKLPVTEIPKPISWRFSMMPYGRDDPDAKTFSFAPVDSPSVRAPSVSKSELGPKSPSTSALMVAPQAQVQVSQSNDRPKEPPRPRQPARRFQGSPLRLTQKAAAAQVQRGLGNATCDAPPERSCWSRLGWQTERYHRARQDEARLVEGGVFARPSTAPRRSTGGYSSLAGDKISEARASIAAKSVSQIPGGLATPGILQIPRRRQGTSGVDGWPWSIIVRGAYGWTNENWLKSRFHFNFAEYSEGPGAFGVLRVMNDDLVQGERGRFGEHPHRDMEIMTFIVDGYLTHKARKTLGRGSVQFMTAATAGGSGIYHSEHNLAKEPLRFIQCWVVPRSRGLKPNYGSAVGNEEAQVARRDQWAQLVTRWAMAGWVEMLRAEKKFGAPVSDEMSSVKTPVKIHQDCNVFVTELSPNVSSKALSIGKDRQAYLLCMEGSCKIAGQDMQRHDSAEIKGPLDLELLSGSTGAYALVFEMALTRDARRGRKRTSQSGRLAEREANETSLGYLRPLRVALRRRLSTAAASRNDGFLSRLEEEQMELAAGELQGMRAAGTFKVERVLESPQSGAVTVAGGSKPVLNFCANNYLGLSSHPSLVKAAQETLSSHGFGLSSVRFICGTQDRFFHQ